MKTKKDDRAVLVWRDIPCLEPSSHTGTIFSQQYDQCRNKCLTYLNATAAAGGGFACASMEDKREERELAPTTAQLLKHPLAVGALVPKEAALFAAGAVAGAVAKSVTAPLDRVKLLMQTHGLRAGQEGAKKAIGFIEVIRIIPYSAIQLFAYETYKKLFKGKDGELSVIGRLAAGACAGMTSTFVTYPLDVLRLRLAVEPGYRTMTEVALNMLRDEGAASFYNGLGPALVGIAPYIAVNFCVFDLVKNSLPEKYQKKDRGITNNSSGVSYYCHSHVLSFGHSEKTNANEEYTLQDIF